MWPISPEIINNLFPTAKILSFVEGLTTDSRSLQKGDMFVALQGEKFDGHDFVMDMLNKGAVCALVSESWAKSAPLEFQDRLLYKGDSLNGFREFAKLFRQHFNFPVFAIGGSNGKTTTKEMLAALLSGRNIGISKTDKSENGFVGVAKTLTMRHHHQNTPLGALVLEIGIDDMDAMAQHVALAQPDCALLTALGPEHLEGLGTHQKAIEEEMLLFKLSTGKPRIWQLSESELFRHLDLLEPQDCLVIDEDDFPRDIVKLGAYKISQFQRLYWRVETPSPASSRVIATWLDLNHGLKKMMFQLPMPGKHNAQNFALALATSLHLGWTAEEIEKGWKNFVQPPMRSRVVELRNGITLYDDCYNASPLSMKASLASLEMGDWKTRSKIIILGDMLDLGEHTETLHLNLVSSLLAVTNAKIFLYGHAIQIIYKTIPDKLKNRIFHINGDEDPTTVVKQTNLLNGSLILVKGSRGMRLERVVKYLEQTFGENNLTVPNSHSS